MGVETSGDLSELIAEIERIRNAHARLMASLCNILSHNHTWASTSLRDPIRDTVAQMQRSEKDRDELMAGFTTIEGRIFTQRSFLDGMRMSFPDLPDLSLRCLKREAICHRFLSNFGCSAREVAGELRFGKVSKAISSIPNIISAESGGPNYVRTLDAVEVIKHNGLCERTHIVLGTEWVARIQQSNVFVAGLGGVGSWAAEALARMGVGRMTVVDYDQVDWSNKNRQLLALDSTVGCNKARLMKARIREINPSCEVTVVEDMITENNITDLLTAQRYDCVLDCIDTLANKAALLIAAYRNNIKAFSSCGAGNKLDPTAIQSADMMKSQGADNGSSFTRSLRGRIQKEGIGEGITAVFSIEHSLQALPAESVAGERYRPRSTNGTVSYIAPLLGFMLAGLASRHLMTGDAFTLYRPLDHPAGAPQPRPPPPPAPAALSPTKSVQDAAITTPPTPATTTPSCDAPSSSASVEPTDSRMSTDLVDRFASLKRLTGNTPMLAVRCAYEGFQFKVYCKCEYTNMTGSAKDRIILHMLEQGYQEGTITQGTELVEASSGCTATSLAAFGAALGNSVRIFIPDGMSRERMALLRCHGATIVPIPVTRSEGRLETCLKKVEEYAQSTTNCFVTHQFSNPANAAAHYKGTGSEINIQLQRLGRKPTGFVAGVGTGGTVVGAGGYLKEHCGATIHPLQTENSPILRQGTREGRHRVQGFCDDFIPPILRECASTDDIVDVLGWRQHINGTEDCHGAGVGRRAKLRSEPGGRHQSAHATAR